jgi:ABC-type branched-subunit amino acid transport system ATPase component
VTRSDRALLGSLASVGALGVSGLVDVADVGRRVLHQRTTSTLGFVFVAVAVAAVVGPRIVEYTLSVRYELRFAGILFVYAGLCVAVAGYLRWWWFAAPVALVAAALTGAGLRVPAKLLGRRNAAAGAGAIAAGGLVAAFGPVLANAVAVFAATRVWSFARPQTPGGIRASTLVAVVAGVWASGLCGRAGLLLTTQRRQRAATYEREHSEAVLEVRGLDVSYGQLQVLFGVDVHVDPGETIALLGTNGAGKSTVLRAVFGLMRPDAGRAWFDGRDITGRPAERLVREGLVQIPGGRGVFPSLSVADNLRMAGYSADRAAEGIERTLDAFPRLRERINEPAGVLSGGEQQMLALGRAWIARPKLLAIDELTLGLAPGVVDDLLGFVRSFRDEGIAIIVVEQSVYVAYELADRAYFLERGRVRFEGRTRELLKRDDLLRSIFFESASR